MPVVTDADIFDIRNFENDMRFVRDDALKFAREGGYAYIAWNGCIYDASTDTIVFWPTAGFYIRESLPFENWTSGYHYAGRNLWLQGDRKVVFARIPFKS